eukprot:Selendium_serpulae@DN11123_c0_g1_i1.p1
MSQKKPRPNAATYAVIGTTEGSIIGYRCSVDAQINDGGPHNTEHHNLAELVPVFGVHAHNGCVKCLTFSDGILASGATDEMIKLLRLGTLREVGCLMKHNATVTSIDLLQRPAAGTSMSSEPTPAKPQTPKSRSKDHEKGGPKKLSPAAAASHDASQSGYMLSGTDSGEVVLWRSSDWLELKSFVGHSAGIVSCRFHPSGRMAITASTDGVLRLWDLMRAQCCFVQQLPTDPQDVQWSPTGEYFCVSFRDEVWVVHSASSAKCRLVYRTADGAEGSAKAQRGAAMHRVADGERGAASDGGPKRIVATPVSCAKFITDDLVAIAYSASLKGISRIEIFEISNAPSTTDGAQPVAKNNEKGIKGKRKNTDSSPTSAKSAESPKRRKADTASTAPPSDDAVGLACRFVYRLSGATTTTAAPPSDGAAALSGGAGAGDGVNSRVKGLDCLARLERENELNLVLVSAHSEGALAIWEVGGRPSADEDAIDISPRSVFQSNARVSCLLVCET